MNYEKTYKEALERAKEWKEKYGSIISPDGTMAKDFDSIFHELAESEDERIRKEIVSALKFANDGGVYDKHIAYLEKQKDLDKMIVVSPEVWDNAISDAYENGKKDEEKQKEQKSHLTVKGKGVYKICPHCKSRMVRDDSKVYTSIPPKYGYNCPKCGTMEFDTVMYDNPEMEEQIIDSAPLYTIEQVDEKIREAKEWSDEDEKMLLSVINAFRNGTVSTIGQEQWLKNLLKRFNLQPKQEWSEEEKDKLNSIERLIVNANAHGNYLIGDKEATDLQHFIRSIVKPTTNLAEWSEEDEEMIGNIISSLRGYIHYVRENGNYNNHEAYIQKEIEFLNSLRPQPKQDVFPSLSEKEIICLKRALDYLRKEHNRYGGEDFTNEIAVLEWLITHPILVSDTHWNSCKQ